MGCKSKRFPSDCKAKQTLQAGFITHGILTMRWFNFMICILIVNRGFDEKIIYGNNYFYSLK